MKPSSRLVYSVVVVAGDGGGLTHLGLDDPVAEPHPDALPDGLLDLVVVRVGRHQVLQGPDSMEKSLR